MEAHPTEFAVTFDYRCPFARNAHEHLLDGMAAGAPWEVTFVPFFLDQAHVEEGGLPAWDQPDRQANLLALAAAVVVRDMDADHFPAVHRALFTARHDAGGDLRDGDVVAGALRAGGADAEWVLEEVAAGWPAGVVRAEHEKCVAEHDVFGVPTFIAGDRAVFVRLMTRPEGRAELATSTIDRVLDLTVGHPELNEFKATRIPR